MAAFRKKGRRNHQAGTRALPGGDTHDPDKLMERYFHETITKPAIQLCSLHSKVLSDQELNNTRGPCTHLR